MGKKRYRHEFGLGLHCATHQILVILISCVVITSLFYPCLDVYTSSKYSSPAILGFDALLSWGSSNTEGVGELEFASLEFEHMSEGSSDISASLYLAYIGFFGYVVWSVRRMDAVHSRLGLGVTFKFTAITVSTITSLSLCALVGFNVTMVPWELLPIVIVSVGAENMFQFVGF